VAGVVVLVLAAALAAGLASGLLVSVVTDGTSMLPSHHAGDLVVVARTGDYGIGQVVAYRDDASGRIVLHRIVGGDADGFDMRGDNNSSIDPTHPAAADLLGRQVLHVPRVGAAFRSPLGLALVLGVVVVLGGLLVGGRRSDRGHGAEGARRHRRDGRRRAVIAGRVAIVVLDVAAIGGLVATFVVRPHTVVPPPVAQHTGSLSYDTVVPVDEVYPSGRVTTGDPVFLQLVDRLDVVFRYRSEAPAGTQASARLRAELTDGSGWSRTFDVAPLTPVLDGRLELGGSLDLAGMRALVDRVTAATGMPAGPLGLVVVADVDVTIDGHVSSLRTQLPLQLNQLVLHVGNDATLVDVDGDGVDEVTVTAAVDGSVPDTEPIERGGLPAWARKAALALLVLMLAVTVVLWPQLPADEPELSAPPLPQEAVAPPPAADADEALAAPVRAAAVSVGRLVLPVGAVLVDVTDEDALHELAVANAVPVFVGDDGVATVITGLAVHQWRPSAATPTTEIPVVERRLFAGRAPVPLESPMPAIRQAAAPVVPTADPTTDPGLAVMVRYLADPVVNHRAASVASPATPPALRRVRPGDDEPAG
jgi:signal peptidase I